MRMKMMTAMLAMSFCTATMMAQTPAKAPAPAPKQPSLGKVGTQADPAKAIDILLKTHEDDFVGVAKAMPAELYDFSPVSKEIAGAKFAGVRTFADEVKHVAQANFFFFSKVSGLKPARDVRAIGTLKTKAEIVAALEESFAFGHKAIATITAENAFTIIDGADGLDTRATLATFAAAHGYDHYGQMVEYLRMNGLLPPGSK